MLGIDDLDDTAWDKYDKAVEEIKNNYKGCKNWEDSVYKYLWEKSGNKFYKGKLDTNDGIWNIKKVEKFVRQTMKNNSDTMYARGIKIDESKVISLGAGYYRVEVDTQTYTNVSDQKIKGVTVDVQFTDNGEVEYSDIVM